MSYCVSKVGNMAMPSIGSDVEKKNKNTKTLQSKQTYETENRN